jgi:hypothetical protein
MQRFALLLLASIVFFGTVYAQNEIAMGPENFDGQIALQHVANHVAVGPRPVGSPEIIVAGNIILNHLAQLGWSISEDWHILNFGRPELLDDVSRETLKYWNLMSFEGMVESYLAEALPDVSEDLRQVNYPEIIVPIRNLVADFGGGGTTIILGAHYDSRILSDKDSDPSKRTLPMPGANDGGSGVGVLLELARVISQHYSVAEGYTIRLVFFDAEDNGRIAPWTRIEWAQDYSGGYLIGSTLYASGLDLSVENIEYMLLVDLVGDADQRFPIERNSNESAPEIVSEIWSIAAELGYAEQFPNELGSTIIDDHLPFIRRGIPSVDIIDLVYPYWDTSEDTLDKVSPISLERVGRVLQAFLERTGVIVKRA